MRRSYRLSIVQITASLACVASLLASERPVSAQAPVSIIVAVGAGGASEYEEAFRQWAARWEELAEKAGLGILKIGDGADPLTTLQTAVTQAATSAGAEPLWIVLLGHGTYDGKLAKFNLSGPDVTSENLAQWLAGAQRPLVIVNCSSSSAPFINALTGPNRIVITATKSGLEVNYSRFGEHFIAALLDTKADLDKDEQVSVLEAFIAASGDVAEFYKSDNRLATEHALLDDNGDGLGTPGDWFRGVRAIRAARDGASLDGLLARQTHALRTQQELELSDEQRTMRDTLERQVEELRGRKSQMDEEEYYQQLEQLLVQLSRIYEEVE